MANKSYFVKKPEMRKYSIGKDKIVIEINQHVFPPSPHGIFFARNMQIRHNEKVIDIGTGTGILGIVAAIRGGQVYATDVDEKAVELARRNAQRNKVSMKVMQGSLFGNNKKKFDVIIANLPQEIVHPAYKKRISNILAKSIDGGVDGNKWMLQVLDKMRKHMHGKSRAYILINTLTNYVKTMKKMIEMYNARLVGFDIGSVKGFVLMHKKFYTKLHQEGKITIFKHANRWFAGVYLFELKLKRTQSKARKT